MVLNTTNGMFDLWSVAPSAGFANAFVWLVPGVPLRSTPGTNHAKTLAKPAERATEIGGADLLTITNTILEG